MNEDRTGRDDGGPDVDRAYDITVISGAEMTPDQTRALADLQATDPELSGPFFSPEFVTLVASLGGRVHVGLAHREGRVVAALPFQVRDDGSGEPLAHPSSDFHGLLSTPGFRLDPVRFLRGCGLPSWAFHHLLAHQESFRPHHEATLPSPYIDLRLGFDAYARQRREAGTRQLLQIAASARRLETERGEVRFVAHNADEAVLTQLREWKEEKFRLRGIRKTFSPWQWSLLRTLIRTESEGFAGMLSCLYAGGELVAAHAGMRSRTCWHYWYPAYDPGASRYQPGLILLMEMARHAAALGITRIDLSAGDEPYKVRLASASVLLARGRVKASGP